MPNSKKILLVCGTRPEAIKMAPLVIKLQEREEIDVRLCVTGQHREMLDQVLDLFDLVPDYDIAIMKQGQDLTDTTTAILTGLRDVLNDYRPTRALVHGDTTTTLGASLAAFYAGVNVAHVEAGLRTGDMLSPWPEEANRRLTSVLADRHYAPTHWSKENLVRENINPESVLVTGNTVIDALLSTVSRLERDKGFNRSMRTQFDFLDPSKRLILVTGHRRENFGESFDNICMALAELSRRDDVQLVYPVHLNPNVRQPAKRILANTDNVHLLEPLDYLPFVYLMNKSHFIISDSGGIQEEAPALGKPVLLMRKTTERPEAVEAGTVKLVGTDRQTIVDEARNLLENKDEHTRMSIATNPYGSGNASNLICEDLCSE